MTDLPQGWREVALNHVVSVSKETGIPSEKPEYPFVGMEHVASQTGEIVEYGNSADYKSGAVIADDALVLYGRLRPYLNKVFIPKSKCFASGEFIPLRVGPDLDKRYLLHLLRSANFVTFAVSLNAGDRPRVKWEQMGNFPLALPPLAEQERIVEILEEQFSRLDSALASVKAVREKTKAFRRSLLRSLTSEATHFAEPSNVAKVALSEVGKWGGGGTPSKANKSFWNAGDIPWVTSKDMKQSVLEDSEMHITDEAVKGSSTRLVPANSVAIVARSGILEHTLPVALVPFPSTYNQDLKVVTPLTNVSPKWLLYSLQANGQEILDSCRKAGTTVASIEFPLFLRYEILLPSLTEQNRLVGIIEEQFSRLDKALEVANQLEARIASERRSLLHSAFTGALTATWRQNND